LLVRLIEQPLLFFCRYLQNKQTPLATSVLVRIFLRNFNFSSMKRTEMILRDYLAIDRTKLANERTLLAYFRTVILLVATGVTLIKLFPDERILRIAGFGMFPFSLLIGLLGIYSFYRTKKNISTGYKELD
jgi:putative membrane protein